MLKILVPAELTDELKYDVSPISIVSTAAKPGVPTAMIDLSRGRGGGVVGDDLKIL